MVSKNNFVRSSKLNEVSLVNKKKTDLSNALYCTSEYIRASARAIYVRITIYIDFCVLDRFAIFSIDERFEGNFIFLLSSFRAY